MIKGVIFDLDGVIVTTDEYHYSAWKAMADEQGIYFDKQINERLRGVSRMESLDIILEKANHQYSIADKAELAARKNNLYVEMLSLLDGSGILPGALDTITSLRRAGIKIAIGSASKNTKLILKQLRLMDFFNAVVDGNDIAHGKPDPEIFLLAADRLDIKPQYCLVVEDADAGVEAAIRGGMAVLGVGPAYNNNLVTIRARTLADINLLSFVSDEKTNP
jgi:beta-phosphoglucomutase